MPIIPSRGSEPYQAVNQNTQSERRRTSIKNLRVRAENNTVVERLEAQDRINESRSAITALKIGEGFISFTKTLAGFGQKIYGSIADSQQSSANVDLKEMQLEGNDIANGSILDGSSGFVEIDENAPDDPSIIPFETEPGAPRMGFKVSDSFREWYDAKSRWIDEESGYVGSVKDAMHANLDNYYWGMVESMQSSAWEKAYTDLENNFGQIQEISVVADSQLFSQYGEKLPEGVTYEGIANIQGRRDWSPERKQAEAAAYMQQVMYLGAQDRAAEIARTDERGMAAVDEYVSSLGFLTQTQKNSVYSVANQSYVNMKNGYTDMASSMMAEAFMDGGSTPAQVYQAINDTVTANGIPKPVAIEMLDSARAEQRQAVQAMGDNTLANDTVAGYADLVAGREAIASGEFDSYYYGIPEEKDKLIAKYDSAIAEIETATADALNKDIDTIREMDKQVITDFNQANDDAFALFDAGAITGQQYGQLITANTQVALGESEISDSTIIAGWHTAFAKGTEAYVEDVYADTVEDKVEALLVAEGRVNATKSKRTPEEIRLINDMITRTNGSIMNALWDYGKKAVPIDSVLNHVERAYQSVVLRDSVLGKDDVSDIPLPTDPGVTMKQVITAAASHNSEVTSNPEASYVWYDHAEAYASGFSMEADEEGQISMVEASPEASRPKAHFLDAAVQEAYNRSVDVYRSQLAMVLGVSEEDLMGADNPEAVGENGAIPSPVFYFNGHTYRPRGLVFQEFVDTGEQGDGIGTWVDFAVIQKDGMGPELIREPAGMPEPEAVDMSLVSRNSFRAFFTVEKPEGEVNATPTAITVDPRIVEAHNYSEPEVLRLVHEDPELRPFHQLIQRQLKYLENSRTEEE